MSTILDIHWGSNSDILVELFSDIRNAAILRESTENLIDIDNELEFGIDKRTDM